MIHFAASRTCDTEGILQFHILLDMLKFYSDYQKPVQNQFQPLVIDCTAVFTMMFDFPYSYNILSETESMVIWQLYSGHS